MKSPFTALTLLIASVSAASGMPTASAASQPATLAPEVIAPGELPALPVIRSDSTSFKISAGTYRAAPMPDDEASAPASGADDRQMRVRPTMFFQKSHYDGDGYAPGSDDHAKAVQPATGLAVDLPLN